MIQERGCSGFLRHVMNNSLKLLFETQPTCFRTFAYFQPYVSYGNVSHKNECNQKNDKRFYCLNLLQQ